MGTVSRLVMLGAALVLLGAGVLRLTGLDWLLPSLIEQDAHIPVQVRLMDGDPAEAAATLDWGSYPHLVARLTRAFTAPESDAPARAEEGLQVHLERARWPVLRVRLVVAWMSLLALPATWWLARLWLGPGGALLASAFMATSLLAVHFSGQARAHGAAVGLFALAVLSCVHLRRRGDALAYGLAGLAVGLAIACLQSGLATLFPLLVAHVAVVRQRGHGRHLLACLPLVAVVGALLLFHPFMFEASAGADSARLGVEDSVLAQSKHQIFLRLFNGLGFMHLARIFWDWEPALCVASLGAALVWLGSRRRGGGGSTRDAGVSDAGRTRDVPAHAPRLTDGDAPPAADRRVVLSFVLSYGLAVGLYERSYERFLLPLIPFLSVFAAWGVARASTLWAPPARRDALALALGVALLALPAVVATRLVALRLAPDTFDRAAAWVEQHTRPGVETLTVSRSIALPLYRTPASRTLDRGKRTDRGLGWGSFQGTTLARVRAEPGYHLSFMPFDSLAALRQELAQGPLRWVRSLRSDLCLAEVFEDLNGSTELAAVTLALREQYPLRARISPDGDGAGWSLPLVYQDDTVGAVPPMAWRVLNARSFGPVIEIFELRPAGSPESGVGAGR